MTERSEAVESRTRGISGVAGWILRRLRSQKHAERRLELLERITLGPRQSLALIEAEGKRILVATSAEGGPAFFSLGDVARSAGRRETERWPRISW